MGQHERWAVVTGGGSGIGRALTHALVDRGLRVLIVGRRAQALMETARENPGRIAVFPADLTREEARQGLHAYLDAHAGGLHLLVHNAALLAPVAPLTQVAQADWAYHLETNLSAPLFLSQTLLPLMRSGSRILHISSGAAHKAYEGWGAYCTSKAALNMLYRCLDLELRAAGIRVGSARPGVVDTPMQDQVRQASPEVFPLLPRFQALKQDGALTAPRSAALFLCWLLLDCEAETFAAAEWDLRDTHHQHHWLP